MSRIDFELSLDENNHYVVVVNSGNVPHHEGAPLSDPELMSDFDHCYTPGDALRVFADMLDRSMAAAWFETAAKHASEAEKSG